MILWTCRVFDFRVQKKCLAHTIGWLLLNTLMMPSSWKSPTFMIMIVIIVARIESLSQIVIRCGHMHCPIHVGISLKQNDKITSMKNSRPLLAYNDRFFLNDFFPSCQLQAAVSSLTFILDVITIKKIVFHTQRKTRCVLCVIFTCSFIWFFTALKLLQWARQWDIQSFNWHYVECVSEHEEYCKKNEQWNLKIVNGTSPNLWNDKPSQPAFSTSSVYVYMTIAASLFPQHSTVLASNIPAIQCLGNGREFCVKWKWHFKIIFNLSSTTPVASGHFHHF